MMFLTVITSKIRKELEALDFKGYQDLEFMKSKVGVYMFSAKKDNKFYRIRFYENGGADVIASNCVELLNQGLPIVEIITYSKLVIVTSDYEENGTHNRLDENDLKCVDVVKRLASLCQKMCFVEKRKFDDLNDYFSIGAIGVISKKMNIKSNKVLNYILVNFDNISNKLNRLEKSAIFLGLSKENVLIEKGNNLILFDVVENVFYGYRYKNVDLFLNMLGEEEKMVFLKEFGNVNEVEFLINKLMNCLFNLYAASITEITHVCVNKYLEEINSENMFDIVRSIVDWH